jgi:hypothetical protein
VGRPGGSVSASARRKAARAELWRRGNIRYLLREHQRSLHEFIDTWRPDEARKVVRAARRFGKSYVLCLYATEFAIRNAGCQIRFAAPTEKALRKIVKPNMRAILADCPERYRPRFNTQDSCFVFPNGSEWHLAGTDKDNAEKLRGTGTDLAIVDEAGFHDDLEYIVDDILTPQLLDNGGRMVMISTPPRTPGHPFAAKFCPEADAEGSLFVRTIRDNTHLKPDQVERYVKALGGWDSLATRRELLCEDVVDVTRAVLPEFHENAGTVVREPDPCEWFIPLVSLDVGFEDLTAILFGFYDFARAKLVIVDEAYLKHARTDQIANAIKAKEAALWPWAAQELERTRGDTRWKHEPWRTERRNVRRFSDVDPRLIADLADLHGLPFAATAKDDKEAAINALRIRIREASLVIHPRCVQTVRHFRQAVWHVTNRGMRTGFEHSEYEGHFDGVDSAVYMNRNAPIHVNPYPPRYATVDPMTHLIPEETEIDPSLGPWAQVFGKPH